MNPIPILIPIILSQKQKFCPDCKKPEDIIEVCNHCGHRYPSEDFPVMLFWIPVIGAVLGALFIFQGTSYVNKEFIDYFSGGLIGLLAAPLVCGLLFGLGCLIVATIKKIFKN